ncbi:tRNA (adenosine(37)-N6)-dimethylallyltransferase MiaA [Aestuariirhabdus sp. Z084]|uniref:tRNA (adenosine(37)-N6)-dimethylallyltransferase MiaA n=1 Tax=Aestuariirhabdus haliotis TaxID=2918751 RepID=UPI00201B3F05|nr:tRNA (adenosine(37)-N6)-dimethylallyltransferase MiaA [Aestuariirhabdus haliotis]MCL6415423.1 tRNA (adenosine(37)-N6)-dimethylallyltransferase MiaA [Aestuariirhabdus haliotis]MCL6419179.1 tRNA (adenosine(37)-N6)-dimethylallyltransferase MiaA [Aestuariirhabdus haliotis]
MVEQKVDLLVVLGPTASGKTRLGIELAREFGGEILSADSRQVYRGMDIGSGKDLQEYVGVPYHLIDIVDAGEEYNVYRFQQDFFDAFEAVRSKGAWPVMVGGSGLYLEAVIKGYRLIHVPENQALRSELAGKGQEELVARLAALKPLHNTTDSLDRKRLVRAIEVAEGEGQLAEQLPALPKVSPLLLGIRWPRKVLRQRITRRLKERFEEGMIEEVEGLHAEGVPWFRLQYYGLEYRYIADFLQGNINSRNDLFQKLNAAIHQYAKRQDTWFRRMERQGHAIHWVEGEGDPVSEARAIVQRLTA